MWLHSCTWQSFEAQLALLKWFTLAAVPTNDKDCWAALPPTILSFSSRHHFVDVGVVPVWLPQDESRSGNRLLDSAQWHALWETQSCTTAWWSQTRLWCHQWGWRRLRRTFADHQRRSHHFMAPLFPRLRVDKHTVWLIRVGQCSRSGGVSQELSFSSNFWLPSPQICVCLFAHHLPTRLAERLLLLQVCW